MKKRGLDKQLAKPQHDYHHLLDVMDNFVGIADDSGRLRFASKDSVTELGYDQDEIVGRPFWEASWFSPSHDSQEAVRDGISMALKGENTKCEVDVYASDNTPLSLTLSMGLLDATEGKQAQFIGIAATTKPIMEQRRVEEVGTPEPKFRSMFEIIADAYFRIGKGGNFSLVNPSSVKLLDYESTEELLEKNTAELWAYPEQRSEFLKQLMGNRKVDGYEAYCKKKNGSLVAVELDSHLMFDSAGEVIGSEGIFRDITE